MMIMAVHVSVYVDWSTCLLILTVHTQAYMNYLQEQYTVGLIVYIFATMQLFYCSANKPTGEYFLLKKC